MKYFICIFLLFSSTSLIFSQEGIQLKSADELLRIEDKVMILEDKNGELTIQDILKAESQAKFQNSENISVDLFAKNSAHWLKLTFSNHSKQDAWLAIDRSFILLLDFYASDKNGNYNKIIQTGALRPFESRAYPVINGFWLPLNKAEDKRFKTYYIRMESYFILDIVFQIDNVLEIASLPVLHQQKTSLDNLSNAFIGLMLVMALYNSFLYFLTKEKLYFLYTGYVVFITFAATFLNSYPIIEYLTRYQLQYFWNDYFSIWAYPILIFSGLFCIQYLDLKTHLPLAKKVIEGIILSQLLVIFLNLTDWISMFLIVILEQLVPLALYLVCIGAASYLFFFKNLKQARYYLLGWSFFLLGIILLMLSANRFIPFNFYVRNASYFGIALEVWMFSLALGDRMRFLRKENEKVQVRNLTLIEEQKNILEQEVTKRTREIKKQSLELQTNQEVLQKNKLKLEKVLRENQIYTKHIELQREEEKLNNKRLASNQDILQKSRNNLKKALGKNKRFIEEIQIQNETLQAKEEEIRQNFEELQSTQDALERKQRQLQVALAENQSITKALNNSAIISITDLKGDILSVNDIFCQTAGYEEDELIGKNQSIVNSGYHPKEFWKEMWAIIGKGNTWRGEVRNRAKDGSIYWVDAVINPMFNDHGKIYSYLSIRYLITDKKEIEEKIQLQNRDMARKNKKIAHTIQAISNLAKNPNRLSGDWQAVSSEAIQAGTEALEVDTCQLWYYNFKEIQMYCIAHDSVLDSPAPNTTNPQDNPLFFRVLKSEQLLMVNDIENDTSLTSQEKAFFLHQGYKAIILFPLILSEKQRGLLISLHQEVHTWENEDIIFLKSLNDEFAFAFQTYKREQALQKIEEQNEKIVAINRSLHDSINYAERIQQATLPKPTQLQTYLPQSFIFFKPRDIVSGDFYFFTQKNYKFVVAAVDCTGHGIPGAFMSLIGHNLLNEIVNTRSITRPDKILNALREGINQVLKQEQTKNHDGMDIAICSIDQHPEDMEDILGVRKLEYAGAGNPLIYFQDNELQQIKADKIIIGGFNNYLKGKDFTLHSIPLDKPTTFYLFSDGIQDQFGGKKNRRFTTRGLRNLLQEIHQKGMQEQQHIISETIENWQIDGDQAQIDDMILIGVKV